VPPGSTILSTEEVLTRDKEARLRAAEATRVAALKAIFESWTATYGAADWLDFEALAQDLVVEWGRRADLIVLERPGQHRYASNAQALPAALFETDRPVLVVPVNPAAGFARDIAIAWRDDPHATRAVLSALRFIGKAVSVHLLAGVRPGAPEPRIPEILTEHGIAAQLHTIPLGKDPFGLALLAKAHAIGADMLVMGAYAHSPWRQMVLGGTTRSIIAHADIPVLMRH
jgi:nucleotide-binding universal stress UspA family protein